MIFATIPPKDQFFATIWYLITTHYKFFLLGIAITLLLSIIGTIGGFLLALPLNVLRMQQIDPKRDQKIVRIFKRIGHGFVKTYVTIFRGTPMIVQAMIFYYGIAPLRLSFWTPLVAGLFVVTLNTTAYICEVIRSGINGVDQGQLEAARSLGFTHNQSMFKVVLPQAIKNSLPSIGNEFIVNLKDTAVLSVIGVTDLFRATENATSSNFRTVEGFFIAAVIYLILTWITSRIVSKLEQKNRQGGVAHV